MPTVNVYIPKIKLSCCYMETLPLVIVTNKLFQLP